MDFVSRSKAAHIPAFTLRTFGLLLPVSYMLQKHVNMKWKPGYAMILNPKGILLPHSPYSQEIRPKKDYKIWATLNTNLWIAFCASLAQNSVEWTFTQFGSLFFQLCMYMVYIRIRIGGISLFSPAHSILWAPMRTVLMIVPQPPPFPVIFFGDFPWSGKDWLLSPSYNTYFHSLVLLPAVAERHTLSGEGHPWFVIKQN